METALIISNTTPLINFAEIGRMDVLQELFGGLALPPAVIEELEAKRALFPKAATVPLMPNISIVTPADRLLVKGLMTIVHSGEAECLALAMERPGSLLLLDDLKAREMAAANGILFIGTLGCIVEGKRRGLFPAVEPVLDDLRTKARFWISDRLADRILSEAGER